MMRMSGTDNTEFCLPSRARIWVTLAVSGFVAVTGAAYSLTLERPSCTERDNSE